MRLFFYLLIVALIVAQFFRPERNLGVVRGDKYIGTVYNTPPQVESILQKACFDCHSNATRYPWYTRVQPIGWWLAHHIEEGKEHLNFSEFANLDANDRAHVLKETCEQIELGEMPLRSYTWVHRDADLTQAEKEMLVNWAKP